jgi:hypothetical protein
MTQATPTQSPSEEGNKFYELLGRCISAWAIVDDELFLIFRNCLGPYEQSAIIFYRTPGLDVRLHLTTEIVLSVLPKSEKKSGAHPHRSVKAWNRIVVDFEELLSVRRRLAHHPVSHRYDEYFAFGQTSFGSASFYSGQPIQRRFQVHVGDHERLREKSAKLLPLTKTDLASHLSLVRTLANRLNDFLREHLQRQLEESLRLKREQSSD